MFDIPQSEQCIIAAILMDPNSLKQIRAELVPEDFTDEKNRTLYHTMLELADHGEPIIPTAIVDHLRQTERDKVVGSQYIAGLLANIHTSAGFGYHVKQVKSNRVKASLMAASSYIADASRKSDPMTVLSEIKDRLSQIKPIGSVQQVKSLSALLPGVVDSIERKEANTIPTGLIALDNLITGWHPGDLIILAARPGMGKSVLGKDFAEASGVPTLYFSLEMPNDQLIKRQIAAHSGINYTSIRRCQLVQQDCDRIIQAVDKLHKIPISYSDQANMSVDELVNTCETKHRTDDIGMVVVDYLQLLRTEGKIEHREQEVAQISRKLKGLARDLNIPVICLAQLNRSCEARGGDKKPMLSDLRESGSLEQDADTVIFIWREAMYVKKAREDGTTNEHEAVLIVAKGRNTQTGAVRVFFDGAHQRFGNLRT